MLTVGVHNGDDVEVVVVKSGLGGLVAVLVALNELVGHVLDGRGDDPLASVDGSVPDDGGLGARAIGTVDVNALERAALERLAGNEDLRVVGEAGLQVLEELVVAVEVVVRVEVGEVGQVGGARVLGLDGAWCLVSFSFSLTFKISAAYTYGRSYPTLPPRTCRRRDPHGGCWS